MSRVDVGIWIVMLAELEPHESKVAWLINHRNIGGTSSGRGSTNASVFVFSRYRPSWLCGQPPVPFAPPSRSRRDTSVYGLHR